VAVEVTQAVQQAAAIRGRWVAVLVGLLALVCVAGGAGWLGADPDLDGRRTAPGTSALPVVPGTPGAVSHSSPTATTTPSAGRPLAAGAPSAARPPSTGSAPGTGPLGDGTYRVGVTIAAGTWSTGGVVNIRLRSCSYAVNGDPSAPRRVAIGATAVHLEAGDLFVTRGCQPWRWSG
jgi:hypothetical protein